MKRTIYLSIGILVLGATLARAEVLDKMPAVNQMIGVMLGAASVSGVLIFLAFRSRLGWGAAVLLIAIGLNLYLPDPDPFVRNAVINEAAQSFSWVYYGRWILLFLGCVMGIKAHGRRRA